TRTGGTGGNDNNSGTGGNNNNGNSNGNSNSNGNGGNNESGNSNGGGENGDGSGSGSGGAGGSGGGTSGSGGGTGDSESHHSGPTGSSGNGTGPAFGPSGMTGAGTSGALSGTDPLSLFSEVLQLISSAIPTLVQLGNQLAAQLGPGLQALVKSVEDGATTVKQALADAAELIEDELGELEDLVSPSGATGPVTFAVMPEIGRAGGNQPEFFVDFTSTRSTDAVAGTEVTTIGAPGISAEGDR
ncbi:hypothetical protein ACWDSF_29090, partial [Nocardia beijingensis]